MAIERVILDLQEKVLKLSAQVDQLNHRVTELEQQSSRTKGAHSMKKTNDNKYQIQGKITKKLLIEGVQEALTNHIPAANIRKGTQAEGSGLIITNGDRQITVALRGSGYYERSGRMKYTGFSTLTKDAIMDHDGKMRYDFYVFGVSLSDDPEVPHIEFFIFNQQQFRQLLAQKKPGGASQMYYFYFGETADGHFIDDRERDTTVSVDEEHDSWANLIQQYQGH